MHNHTNSTDIWQFWERWVWQLWCIMYMQDYPVLLNITR